MREQPAFDQVGNSSGLLREIQRSESGIPRSQLTDCYAERSVNADLEVRIPCLVTAPSERSVTRIAAVHRRWLQLGKSWL